MTQRIFITGGSGFIGTNLVEHFATPDRTVVNFDELPPRNPAHARYWQSGNLCDAGALNAAITQFQPNVILHAGARTDLRGFRIEDYAANTRGVENVIAAARLLPNLDRLVLFSSILVCDLGYTPKNDTDYKPTTAYGESKVYGERVARAQSVSELPWVLVRPASIWGPWFGAPYRNFFEAVHAGWFILPRRRRPLRSFGYVANLVAQVHSIVAAEPAAVVGKTFNLADYAPLDIAEWANAVSRAWGGRQVREVPLSLLRFASLTGDVLQVLGYRNPPLTSSRLRNLLTSAVVDTSNLAKLCPRLPVSTDEGVELTVQWLQHHAGLRTH